MTTPNLPSRVSLGFRKDKHLSFTGLDENRSLPHCEQTIAIRDLLEDIYADATPSDDLGIDRPQLGQHIQIRWTTQGGAKLRFYLKTTKKNQRPKFHVPADARTIKLRGMVEEAYAMARTEGQRVEEPVVKTEFEIETEEYMATLSPKSEDES